MVTEAPILAFYELDKYLFIQCDAIEQGLEAALMQEGRPLAYASRTLISAERSYAQIEKEVLKDRITRYNIQAIAEFCDASTFAIVACNIALNVAVIEASSTSATLHAMV